MTRPSRSRTQQLVDVAIPFIGVGTGAVTVVWWHSPHAVIPRSPYWPWFLAVGALAAFALILAVGLEDGWSEDEEVHPVERWRALLLTYVAGLVASGTFVATVAVIDLLE
jgi:uncharacterized membrane protein YhaH (DUF805 family)